MFNEVAGREIAKFVMEVSSFKLCANLTLLKFQGFNATIMVYGQTGSGKSYTMEGYEYVMAEKRASLFGPPQVGLDMKALIGTTS